ncbi:DUF4124 domain-containing protein [Thauera aromatica]|uniref:DUF4124 domain-containing protein n=1 Tax=Thauera aromatica TaxID=59405 RepID=UPI001FFC6FC4|nr:DUF4124 domain-containing protein [Thauera aromatica]MCK2095620.1 DUF4124 domain-containing protein [Thauera aromatica]
MRRTVAVLALLISVPVAQAQVYKCQIDGSTTFSDMPCGNDAREIDVTPATGSYNPAEGWRRAADVRQLRLRQELERIRSSGASVANVGASGADQASKDVRCGEIRREKRSAEWLAENYVMKKNIERAKRDAKQADSNLWWECR